MKKNEFFANYLLSHKKISQKVFDSLTEKFFDDNFDILDNLLVRDEIKPMDRLEAIASFYDIPALDLDSISIMQNIEKYFSLELMKKFLCIPLYVAQNGTMVVGVSEFISPSRDSAIKMIYGGKIEYALLEKQKIIDFLNRYEATLTTKKAISSFAKNEKIVEHSNTDDLYVQDAPAVKFVDSIIREAVPLKASDIHIEPNSENVIIRYRIDGDLVKWTEFPLSSYQEIAARIKILSGIDIAEKRIPQDGHLTMNINGEDVNFRVSTLPTINGEKFVIRILDNKIFSYNLKQLNFSKTAYKLIEKILAHPHGIILLTGPTGSGKTTTLYAFLRELNTGKNNIVTIEDPVEYAMDGINQIQVNKKANLTFASSLRSILRQDPDIVMVGEIRDEETAQIATRAAITGHLVLSTLHTNDAAGAVIRLVDMGIPQYLVGDAMVAVLSQRLVKRLCPHCRKKIKTSKSAMTALGLKTPRDIYKPQGCPYCGAQVIAVEWLFMKFCILTKISKKKLNISKSILKF